MLKIRKEQYEELGKISLKRFEDSVVEHIREFFPEQYDALGEAVVRKVIEYGVDRAEAHGFETEPDVNMYIDLMLLLGSNFDTDPQLPWAAEILHAESIEDESTEDESTEDESTEDESIAEPFGRVEKLYDQAIEYLDRIEGPEDEYLINALDEFSDISFEELPLTRSEDIENTTISLLRRIWPEKYQAIGTNALNHLIIYATESIQRYNITSQRGVVLYTVLMFMLGSGFDTNPQFPWATTVLKDESIINEAARIDQLYKKAITFLDEWLVES
ncbi:MAG: hypothetical protein ACYSUY_10885 [Planctomycetota bacterium]|jgi:hypothetical protein